jgi:hypothetical protein
VICSDGHPSSKIAALGWNPEDEWLDPALRELVGGPERLIVCMGATVSAGGRLLRDGTWTRSQRAKVEEVRPDGGSKTRFRCEQCRRDVPICWDILNTLTAGLYEHGVARIELRSLEAMLKSSSRKAGPS